MYPKKFEDLIKAYEKIPGVGAKTAQRYAFGVLDYTSEELDSYIEALKGIKAIHKCPVCGFISDENGCHLCNTPGRDKTKIMVVGYPQEVLAIEKTNSYNGLYHVLNGVISASKGIYPEDIGIESLLKRINKEVKEVIVATSATLDGETTALYLDKVLKDKKVLVTRLAHGLPMGSSLDYADDLTLIKAFNNRTKL